MKEADECLYYRYGQGVGVTLYLYVDDILIVGTTLDVIKGVRTSPRILKWKIWESKMLFLISRY